MQLVGATKSFIRRPFIWNSILYGFLGALIANCLLSVAIYALNRELGDFIGFNNVELIGVLFIVVIALGIILSLFSTYLAINKYLRLKTHQLYF